MSLQFGLWSFFSVGICFYVLASSILVVCISDVISLVTPTLQKISNVSSLKFYAPPKSLIPFGD